MNGKCFRMAVAVLLVVGGVGCSTGGVSENNYNCTGYCNGEPMPPATIQAPDPKTACVEYLEYCRGAGICQNCS